MLGIGSGGLWDSDGVAKLKVVASWFCESAKLGKFNVGSGGFWVPDGVDGFNVEEGVLLE